MSGSTKNRTVFDCTVVRNDRVNAINGSLKDSAIDLCQYFVNVLRDINTVGCRLAAVTIPVKYYYFALLIS